MVFKKYFRLGMRFISLFLICFIGYSCVPLKKQIYLQSEEDAIVIDSVFQTEYKEYSLKIDDILSIRIASLTPNDLNFLSKYESDFNSSDILLAGYRVDKEGNIEIPVIGKVRVMGSTTNQVKNKVVELLEPLLDSPVVDVRLLSFSFTLLGEFNSPGQYTSYKSNLTLLEAFGQGGDLTSFADRSEIRILRSENGEVTIKKVNVLRDDLLIAGSYYLKPNDIVIVNPLKIKVFRQYSLANYGIILSTLTALSLVLFRFN